MIVEDELIISQELSMILNRMGYSVTSMVSSGDAAIKNAEQDRPDIILMDINLKGAMDGIEAADIITSRCKIPVIFLTACSDDERFKRAN